MVYASIILLNEKIQICTTSNDKAKCESIYIKWER